MACPKVTIAWAAVCVLFASLPCRALGESSSSGAGTKPERRIIVNWDEECMFAPLFKNRLVAKPDGQFTKKVLEEIIDEHAAVGVDTIVHCVFGTGFKGHLAASKVAEVLQNDLRPPGLDEAGLDFFGILLDRCRKHKIEFVAGLRMNDRHQLPPGRFIREHPEWQLKGMGNGMDYAQEGVRDHVLAYVKEVLDRHDVDGVEFDYMRWCHMFKPGEGRKHAHLLTDFTRKARLLLDAAAKRRGRGRLVLGVRVPQTLKECDHLGFDVAAWVKQGLADWVVPSDFFFPDYNMRTEDFVKLTEGTRCKIYPAIMPLSCWSGNARRIGPANYRAAANNFYAFGASGVSPYNYQVHWQRRRHPSRGPVVDPHMWPAALAYLSELRDPRKIKQGDRHYLFHALWQDRSSVTGLGNNERIVLDRSKTQPTGSQRFRVAENLSDPRLRATLEFKAVGLTAAEQLDIRLNGTPVPGAYTTRVFDKDGQSIFEGVALPAFHQYAVDLNWDTPKLPIVHGDNQLSVGLVQQAGKGKVTIAELEFYVYVRK